MIHPTLIFSFFLLCHISSVSFAQVQVQWSESEHLELAEIGAAKACAELNISIKDCPIKKIQRADKKLSFKYGELVAAADFYHTPLAMDQDKAMGISKLIKCAHSAVNDLPDLTPQTPEASNCNLTGFLAMPGYLEVLTSNYSHFGWNNMVSYIDNHQMALKKAQESFNKKTQDPKLSLRLFHQALIYNGFADHYLTDAFASGHIRVPRIQIKKWAIKNLPGPLRSHRGDLLSLIIHDHESRNLRSGQEEGLRVKNSMGDLWMTRGDGDLHTNVDENDVGFLMPMMAVKESFKEVLLAWQTGEVPDGIYSATKYVPFHDDVPMIIKFSPEYQKMKKREMIRLIYSAIPFLKGFWFQKSDVERMLSSLDKIFSEFQFDVAKEIHNNSELHKRLPIAYQEAYKKVD